MGIEDRGRVSDVLTLPTFLLCDGGWMMLRCAAGEEVMHYVGPVFGGTADSCPFSPAPKIAVPVIPHLTYTTPMLYMVGHPMIPKADAPSRDVNYATGMVA